MCIRDSTNTIIDVDVLSVSTVSGYWFLVGRGGGAASSAGQEESKEPWNVTQALV